MTDSTHTIFMLVRTTAEWLALEPKARFAFLGRDIVPILAAHPAVKMRFFDAEGYNARVSDVVVWETADLKAYRAVVDSLRETAFWTRYFEVTEIIPGVENDYAAHYRVDPVAA
jgi:hypothetical protein